MRNEKPCNLGHLFAHIYVLEERDPEVIKLQNVDPKSTGENVFLKQNKLHASRPPFNAPLTYVNKYFHQLFLKIILIKLNYDSALIREILNSHCI